MPNPTFFNLPEPKRQRLMDAVWQEFTSASYMDASINKIIQAANISRGSFYQYFSGKQDVFGYLLQTLLLEVKAVFHAQLTVHGNDLFSAVLGMYDTILWKNRKTRRDISAIRMEALLRLNAELDLCQFAEDLNFSEALADLQEIFSQAGYELGEPLHYRAIVHMFLSTTIFNLSDTMRHPANNVRNRQFLEFQLQVVRQGLSPYRKEPVSC